MKSCINHPNRRVFSLGLCVACYKKQYQKPLKRVPLKKRPYFIKRVADKRRKQLKAYKPLKEQYLIEHPTCEIKGLNCQIHATEIHHKSGKENKKLLDIRFFKASCHNCHREITDNSKKAIKSGHSVSRHKK